MGDDDPGPTSPIKTRPLQTRQWFFIACGERGGGRGPERGRVRRAGWRPPFPTPPSFPALAPGVPESLPPRPSPVLPKLGGLAVSRRPRRGPRGAGPRGRAP